MDVSSAQTGEHREIRPHYDSDIETPAEKILREFFLINLYRQQAAQYKDYCRSRQEKAEADSRIH